MAQKINGRITNYRTGIRAQTSKEILIEFTGITSSGLAGKLVGKKVTWKNETTTMIGRIMGPHGKNGIVRARFNHGVPGQAIGTIVKVNP
ncbi:MAG: 50S ribosomal protein L35ae [Ignavibacteria bacterium]